VGHHQGLKILGTLSVHFTSPSLQVTANDLEVVDHNGIHTLTSSLFLILSLDGGMVEERLQVITHYLWEWLLDAKGTESLIKLALIFTYSEIIRAKVSFY
jgi:hypothetical protein